MAASPAPRLYAVTPGGVDDLDAVMRVMGEAFPPCFGEGWSRSQCAGILPMTGVTLSLARDGDGDVAGFALARTVMDESELLLIGVDRAHQGQGVGSLLLDGFVAAGRALGLRLLHLEVRDGNRAIHLYRRHGFETIGRRKDYYRAKDGNRHDAVTMAIDLR